MRRRYKKEGKSYVGKLVIAIILVSVVVVSSIVTVMANTVPCTVVDGDKSYNFSMLSPAVPDIVAKAVSQGMEPLQEADRVRGEKGEIVIERALTITLDQNGTQTSVVAYGGETLGDALTRAKIAFTEKDKLEPAVDTILTKSGQASLVTYTPAVVWVDGVGKRVELHGGTVADALQKAGITLGKKDKVSPAANTPLTPELFIKLQTAKEITLVVGGESKLETVFDADVESVLKTLAIEVGTLDRLSPAVQTPIVAGMTLTVDRVTLTETTETQSIDYDTVYVDDSSMDQGSTAVDTQGASGSKTVTYQDTHVNGILEGRTVLSETVVTNAVDEVILQGTKSAASSTPPTTPTGPSISDGSGSNNGGATFVDYNGNTVSYSNVMSGSSTAYTAPAGAITSLGWTAQVGIVAVNPNIIPYGTRMYIASDDFVYGYAVAGDTGGALMAGDALVDVYYPTYDECAVFGRRNMTVYILP